MKQFKDSKQRQWTITVNVSTATTVRDVCDVNLFDLFNADTSAKVFSDPILLVSILHLLCKSQIEQAQITDEDFITAIYGESLDAGANCLLESVADFFHGGKKKKLTWMLTTANKMVAAIDETDQMTMDQFDKMLDQSMSSQSAGNLQVV